MSANATQEPATPNSSRTVEQHRQSARRAWRWSAVLLPLVFGGVLLVGVAIELFMHRRSIRTPVETKEISVERVVEPLRDAIGSIANINREPEPPSEAVQEQTISRLQKVSVIVDLIEAERMLLRHDAARREWEQRRSDTANNMDGQRIAADKQALRKLVTLCELDHEQSGRDWKSEVSELKNKVRSATELSTIHELAKAAQEITDEMLDSEAKFIFYLKILESLIHESSSNKADNGNSFDVVQAYREEQIAERSRLAAEAARKARDVASATLSQLVTQRDASVDTLRSLQQQLEDLRSGRIASGGNQTSTVSRIASRDEYRKNLPEIRTLLKPFISAGYAQPKSRDELAFQRMKNPMSFSALVASGALEDTQSGLETLHRMGGLRTETQRNDRPLGSFPRVNSAQDLARPEVVSRVRRAQWLLRQYGSLLLEDGMLSE